MKIIKYIKGINRKYTYILVLQTLVVILFYIWVAMFSNNFTIMGNSNDIKGVNSVKVDKQVKAFTGTNLKGIGMHISKIDKKAPTMQVQINTKNLAYLKQIGYTPNQGKKDWNIPLGINMQIQKVGASAGYVIYPVTSKVVKFTILDILMWSWLINLIIYVLDTLVFMYRMRKDTLKIIFKMPVDINKLVIKDSKLHLTRKYTDSELSVGVLDIYTKAVGKEHKMKIIMRLTSNEEFQYKIVLPKTSSIMKLEFNELNGALELGVDNQVKEYLPISTKEIQVKDKGGIFSA